MINPGDHILFQGDSITNAFRMPQEHCNAYQLGAGYSLLIAAHLLADQPQAHLRFSNRGVCGEGICGLQRRWITDCLELRPDIVSILVGVNDAMPTKDRPAELLNKYETRYRALLTQTREALPSVRLVLCEPFVLPVGDVRADRLSDLAALGEIVRHLAIEVDAALVPLQSVFTSALQKAPAEYWTYDGIHPSAQGHWLIAQAWMKAVLRKCHLMYESPSEA